MINIYNRDCLEGLKEISDNSIDLILTDPPYGVNTLFSSKFSKTKFPGTKSITNIAATLNEFSKHPERMRFDLVWLKESKRVLKNTGSLVVWGSKHNIFYLGFFIQNILKMKIINHLIWYVRNPVPNITRRMFTYATENAIWAVKDKNWVFNYQLTKQYNSDKQQHNAFALEDFEPLILEKPNREIFNGTDILFSLAAPKKNRIHPNQKRLSVIEYLIEILSKEGDLVGDWFLGSGTTAVACKKLNRNFIGFEKDLNYFERARKRLDEFTN